MSSKPSIARVVGDWLQTPAYGELITSVRQIDAKAPDYAPLPDSLEPRLIAALEKQQISQLYSHQREAIDAARARQHTLLVTPTASGKSMCFHLPVLDDLMRNPNGRALYIYPTKALTQDQYTGLHKLIDQAEAEIKTFTFDGDTPADARRAVRSTGQIVLTNPDMLHSGILPHHTRWLALFRNLRWIVIDEVHVYKGVFGSHLANLIRRIKRLCAFHGSNPTFVTASATIANPQRFVEQLLETPVHLVNKSGAPRAARHVVFANPPVVNRQLGIRASYITTTRRIVADLLARNIPTIVFALSRLNVELLVKYLREDQLKRFKNPEQIQGYRGGYLPTRRRRIERGLRTGDIQCVVATNALELGIDIGDLTACVIAGYPGSVASVWQQSGRAGRRSGESLTVLVGRSTALDQYIVESPNYFFDRSPEEARIDPNNLFILSDHLKCAAFELPFKDGEAFGSLTSEGTSRVLEHLEQHRVLHRSMGQYHWMERSFPANHISLRRIHNENFTVIDTDFQASEKPRVIAEVDFHSAHTTLYEHAIYNMNGQQYQVDRLDYDNHKAYVRRVEPDYFTYAHTHSRVQVLCVDAKSDPVAQGEILVSEKVVGFKKVKFDTHENVGYGEVNLPEIEMHTSAAWLTVPESVLANTDHSKERLVDALRGVGKALHTVATVHMMCASRDIGLTVDEPEESGPRLYLYDNIPGGIGFSHRLYELMPILLASALQLVTQCQCVHGCPSCIGAARVAQDEDKQMVLMLIRQLIDGQRVQQDVSSSVAH